MSGQEDSPREELTGAGREEAAAMEEDKNPPKSVLWLIVVLTGLFAAGVYNFFFEVERNGCAMTYMYEYPMYVPVAIKSAGKRYMATNRVCF